FTSLLGLGGSGGGLLTGLFGGGASSFGGLFANGGYLGAGKWGIAGEAGPEIVKGPAQMVPMRDLQGGRSVVYNSDASGADPAAIARLETALDKHTREFYNNVVKVTRDSKSRRL